MEQERKLNHRDTESTERMTSSVKPDSDLCALCVSVVVTLLLNCELTQTFPGLPRIGGDVGSL